VNFDDFIEGGEMNAPNLEVGIFLCHFYLDFYRVVEWGHLKL